MSWRNKFCDDVKSYDNDTLFTQYMYLCGGDDWDGGFTKDGQFRIDVLETELVHRLKNYGFLTSEFNRDNV